MQASQAPSVLVSQSPAAAAAAVGLSQLPIACCGGGLSLQVASLARLLRVFATHWRDMFCLLSWARDITMKKSKVKAKINNLKRKTFIITNLATLASNLRSSRKKKKKVFSAYSRQQRRVICISRAKFKSGLWPRIEQQKKIFSRKSSSATFYLFFRMTSGDCSTIGHWKASLVVLASSILLLRGRRRRLSRLPGAITKCQSGL
jgi:hypothetical protein